MAKHNNDAAWIEIEIDTLNAGQAAAYRQYKQMYAEMKAQRQAFEALMAEGVPAGERMIFGYNFGKLSVAIVPDDRKPAKAAQAKQSLAEYLAGRKASGSAC